MIATDDKLASVKNCPHCSGTYSCTLSTTYSASTCCDHYTTVIYVEEETSEDGDERENYHYLLVIEELVLRRLQSRVWRLIEKTTCHTIKAKAVLRCNTPRNRGPPGEPSTAPFGMGCVRSGNRAARF